MFLFLASAVAVSAVAAWYDFRTGHIPNGLTLGALVFGLIGHFVFGFAHGGLSGAFAELLPSLAGMALCGLVPMIMFMTGGMGGGDVKLFAAIGSLCHVHHGFEAETYSFVVALLVAPAKLAYDGTLLRTLGNTLALVANPFLRRGRKRDVPEELMTWFRLAPAICVGTLVMLVASGIRP